MLVFVLSYSVSLTLLKELILRNINNHLQQMPLSKVANIYLIIIQLVNGPLLLRGLAQGRSSSNPTS